MANRKFSSKIKSLLHFDFPYFNEAGDGLRDEVSNETFSRVGTVNFVGQAKPNDGVVTSCPKFGYRCPQFSGASSYISGTNTSGIFTLASNGNYEFEFFARFTAFSASRVLALKSSSAYTLALALTNEGKFTLAGATSSTAAALNTWHHCLIRITGGKILFYLDGAQIISANFSGAACSNIELGGYSGQMDEFIFRHSAANNILIPTQPYQGAIYTTEIGGFGSAKHGTQTFTANAQINSYGMLATSSTANKLVIPSWNAGKFGVPSVGDELLIHVSAPRGTVYDNLGNFAFRKILSISGTTYTLDNAITEEFNLLSIRDKYYIQAVLIPNFSSLTVNSGITISAKTYDTTTGGGIIALRASNTLTLNGSLITTGTGATRSDTLQITHAGLINNFVLSRGGNIFIAAKSFKASSSARIGATWDGSLTGGTWQNNADGKPGGAGYGGAGGSDTDTPSHGGAGGVGGGGGGSDSGGSTGSSGVGKDAGSTAGMTGGPFASHGIVQSGRNGGTQGVNPNGISGGGGGAGGNGTSNTGKIASAGSNVIIIAENFSCDAAAISTGGAGGARENSGYQCGGGGTGFCYIAVKEMN